MNSLLNQKISIVTNKPQTTRHKILGILSTPGLPDHLSGYTGHHQASLHAAGGDDAIRLGGDPGCRPAFLHGRRCRRRGARRTTWRTMRPSVGSKDSGKPVYLVINKVDLVEKGSLLPIIDFYSKKFPFQEIFPISALKQDGTGDLVAAVVPVLFPNIPRITRSISSASRTRDSLSLRSSAKRSSSGHRKRSRIPPRWTSWISRNERPASGSSAQTSTSNASPRRGS